jgi:hypothetical protein
MLSQSLIWILTGAAIAWFGAIIIDKVTMNRSKLIGRMDEVERRMGILMRDGETLRRNVQEYKTSLIPINKQLKKLVENMHLNNPKEPTQPTIFQETEY